MPPKKCLKQGRADDLPRFLDPKHSFWIPDDRGLASEVHCYDRRAVVLLAFLAGLALVVVGATLTVVRAVGLWRQMKRTGGTFGVELSSFEERSARTERLLAEADRASSDLDAALERLRVSRARLHVLLGALDRAQARVGWLRAFVPSR